MLDHGMKRGMLTGLSMGRLVTDPELKFQLHYSELQAFFLGRYLPVGGIHIATDIGAPRAPAGKGAVVPSYLLRT